MFSQERGIDFAVLKLLFLQHIWIINKVTMLKNIFFIHQRNGLNVAQVILRFSKEHDIKSPLGIEWRDFILCDVP